MEYGHFFSGIGTKTTIIQRPSRVLPEEEPEVSDLLKMELTQRMEIFTGYEVIEAKQEGAVKTLIAKNREDGSLKEFSAEAVMVATGRVSNADLLKPEKTGVKLDERGYIKVNDYLETSKKNIWAFGDAIGKEMFKHVANYEAGIVWHNAIHDHKVEMDFSGCSTCGFYSSASCIRRLKSRQKQNSRDTKFLLVLAFTGKLLWAEQWATRRLRESYR